MREGTGLANSYPVEFTNLFRGDMRTVPGKKRRSFKAKMKLPMLGFTITIKQKK